MNYQWDFSFLLQYGDDGISYLSSILYGALLTIELALISYIIGFLLGTAFGTLFKSRSTPGRMIASLYLNVFRNIPLIVQLFLWFFVIPEVLPEAWGNYIKTNISPACVAVFCMSLYISSRIGVQVASGIDSVPIGLINAAHTIGLSKIQIYRYLIYPLAFRTIYPTLISEATNAPKNVAVAYSIGVFELYFQYKQVLERTSQALELIIIVTALYFLISILSISVMLLIKRVFKLNPWH